jgi:hypothetical protein
MIQFLLPAVAGFVGRTMGKSTAEAEAGEKLDAIKELVGLTPAQSQAVDAIKAQPIEEVRTRRTLGIGPLSPLPENASQRAQDIRNARIAASKGTVTPAEQAQIASSQDPQAAMKALVDKKVNELLAVR